MEPAAAPKYLDEQNPAQSVEHAASKARQKAWLSRGQLKQAQAPAWRPKQVHRKAAEKWLRCIHNIFRQTSGIACDVMFFKHDPSLPWQKWPHLSAAMDLGPDGNCGYHCLERWPPMQINCDMYNDNSHACTRDFYGMGKKAKLWNCSLCLPISMNVPHGPVKNDERRFQTRQLLGKLYKSGIPGTDVPLYMAYASEIIQHLKDMGVQFDDPHLSEEEQGWRWLCKNRSEFVAEGRMTNTCRFLGLPAGIVKHVGFWYIDLFEREYVSIELDFFGSTALKTKLVEEAALGGECPESEKIGSTNSFRPTVTDKALRSCFQNAVVISVMTLQDRSHYRSAQMLACCSSVLLHWHKEQNLALRTAAGACKCWQTQLGRVCGTHQCCDWQFVFTHCAGEGWLQSHKERH